VSIALFIIASVGKRLLLCLLAKIKHKIGKHPKCLLAGEWINKIWYIHITKYYSVIERGDMLIHATIWMNPENSISSKRSQTQKNTVLKFV
jgi:hypothetical protein